MDRVLVSKARRAERADRLPHSAKKSARALARRPKMHGHSLLVSGIVTSVLTVARALSQVLQMNVEDCLHANYLPRYDRY